MENKILKMISLTDGGTFQAASEDGSRNIEWRIIGAALLDNGRVLPLCWDGRFRFKTFDIDRESTLSKFEKELRKLDEEKERRKKVG